MKSIEQKLKLDAQAFKKSTPESVHDTIMQGIENVEINSQPQKRIRNYNWLMPTGLATAALMVLMINLMPVSNQTNPIETIKQNTTRIKLPEINIAAISLSVETNLTSKINAEKKAIQADLNYIKTMFTL